MCGINRRWPFPPSAAWLRKADSHTPEGAGHREIAHPPAGIITESRPGRITYTPGGRAALRFAGGPDTWAGWPDRVPAYPAALARRSGQTVLSMLAPHSRAAPRATGNTRAGTGDGTLEPDHQAMVIPGKNSSAPPGACKGTSLPALIQPAWVPDTKMMC